MENKRKASSANGGGPETDERAAKRRKMPPPPSQFNLLQGESPESTTSYGLAFLDQIRRTQDKSGRRVAGYFEELPSRKGNEDYYAKTPMPVSLRTLEQKLHRREFKNMAEFESWLRRMVKNAKDYYSRHSEVFEDAERVRKAVSNYMTKTNPAYKKIPGYSCQPAPIPEEPVPLDEGDGQDEEDAEGEEDAEAEAKADAEAEAETETKDDEKDGEEEEEDDNDEEEDQEDEDEDEDDDDDNDSDAEAPPKRRGPGRPAAKGKVKPDHEYEGTSYKGLTFQQAQEKIVEEMIRKPDDEEPTWAKFEVFLNLPPRSLKEYFNIIANPLSLKGLQKLVKGIHGRNPPTGVSEFKGWAAFEEKTSLLWENAHYFNEEGSDIYNQATEMKEFFEAELAKAKAVVQEPPQPKIKLRVPQSQDTPSSTGTKKITIHVGGSRAHTTASPAPRNSTPGAAAPPEGATNGITAQRSGYAGPNGVPSASAGIPQLDRMRSTSGSVASPSPALPGVKQELVNGQSPAVTPRLGGVPAQPSPFPPPAHMQAQQPFAPSGVPVQNGFHPPPVERPQPVYNKIKRAPGRGLSDALVTSVHIRGHPNVPIEGTRFNIKIPADPVYAQHSTTVHVPNNQYKLQVIPILAPLEQQNRTYKLFVVCNGIVQNRQAPFPIPGDDLALTSNSLVFDANLILGTNEIQVHMVAALPKGTKLPGGEECEVEVFRIIAQLLR